MVCAIGGSSEMSQIHVQWSHFSRLLVTVDFDVSFNTKVWSVDHIIKNRYISQFETNIFCNFRKVHFAGFPDSSDHEGFQAGAKQCWTQVYCSHGDNLVEIEVGEPRHYYFY